MPDVRDAVRSGSTIGAPAGVHLLMSLYSGPRRFSQGPATRFTMQLTGGRTEELSVMAEIAWPPFHFVFAHNDCRRQWPTSQDVLPWLAEPWEVERDVFVLLPLIGTGDLFGDMLVPPWEPAANS